MPRMWNAPGILGAPDQLVHLAASSTEFASSGLSSGIDASKRLFEATLEHPIAATAIVGGAILAVPAARMAARNASRWMGRGTSSEAAFLGTKTALLGRQTALLGMEAGSMAPELSLFTSAGKNANAFRATGVIAAETSTSNGLLSEAAASKGLLATLASETGAVKGVAGEIPVLKYGGTSLNPEMMKINPQTWLAQIYEKSKGSIARITREDGEHVGTVFVVDKEGIVATNRHVAQAIYKNDVAVFADGRKFRTKLLAMDTEQDADVALLKLIAPAGEKFQPLALGSATRLSSFRAASLGYPMTHAEALPVISPGSIKSIGYGHGASVSLNMKTFYGNSGSPILDLEGKVIGIVSGGNEPSKFTAARTWGPGVQHIKTLLAESAKVKGETGPLNIHTIVQAPGKGRLPTLRVVDRPELRSLASDETALAKLESKYKVRVKSRWIDNYRFSD